MPSVDQVLDLLSGARVDVVALSILFIFLLPFLFLSLRAKRRSGLTLRPIRTYERLQQLVGQAAESGHPIHVGLGSGPLGSGSMAESLMGLTVLDYVARSAAANNHPVLTTAGDPTVLAGAQGVLYQARAEAGFPEQFRGYEANFYGPYPLAYAAGARNALLQREHLANVLAGQYGAEGLWLSESSAAQGLPRLGGTSSILGSALLYTSLDEAVVGEELYAAGAYLHRPSHRGSLATQDIIRAVCIVAVIVGVVLTSLGYWR